MQKNKEQKPTNSSPGLAIPQLHTTWSVEALHIPRTVAAQSSLVWVAALRSHQVPLVLRPRGRFRRGEDNEVAIHPRECARNGFPGLLPVLGRRSYALFEQIREAEPGGHGQRAG